MTLLQSKGKELVICGDMNVVASRLDTFRLDCQKACMTEEERQKFSQLLKECALIDTYRFLHPEKREYSWHYPSGTSGYRLDYVLVSSGLTGRVRISEVLGRYLGSDHTPVSMVMEQ